MSVSMFVCPRSVTESSLGDGIFFFSTTTYGSTYMVVIMSVFCLFVCLSAPILFFFKANNVLYLCSSSSASAQYY
jgi:hypothetical protein